jgi:hypothetical protein
MKSIGTIDDYVSGAMSDDDAERFEEELFAAPDDESLAALDRHARLAAHLVARGTFHFGVTRAQFEAMQRSGMRVQTLELGPPGHVQMRLRRDVDLIVIRYDVGLLGIDRVDIELAIPATGMGKTMRDVLVDPDDGAIYGVCEATLAISAFTAGQVVSRGTTTRDGRPVSLGYVIDAVVE